MKKEETNKLKFYLFPFLFLANTKTSKQQQTTKTRFCLDHRIEEEKSLV